MATDQFLAEGYGQSLQWLPPLALKDKTTNTTKFSVDSSGNQVQAGLQSYGSITTGITAKTGGGQALSATSTTLISVVSTVTSGNDSFTLPASAGLGAIYIVSNQAAANSMQLFGLGSDTINGAASGTGIAVAAKKQAYCVDYALGTWFAFVA
jgi:hypothetical protein